MENGIVVGVPTYGNLNFTRMTVDHIRKTVKTPYELIIVVGKPGDVETLKYCRDNKIHFTMHDFNKGLPASINDLYDQSFVYGNADALVVVGNDVLPHWDSIDMLVRFYDETKFDWISGTVISINGLISKVPSTVKYFSGGDKGRNFIGKDVPEWLNVCKFDTEKDIIVDLNRFKIIGDSHNMCLFSRNLFNTIGYVDVNFYPAYFEDNDYARRAQLAGLKLRRLQKAKYLHFWSRTIHQGTTKSLNDKYFPLNKKFYIEKWGGEPGKERYDKPYNGVKGHINITSRANEVKIIKEWIAK